MSYTLAPEQVAEWNEIIRESSEQAKQGPPLRLADLLEEITYHITKYVYFPHRSLATLVACWIAMTYCFEEFYYSGYLAIRSKKPGSGKTQLLDVLSALSNGNPQVMTAPTPAVLYRSNLKVYLIDEVDNLRGNDRDVYGQVIAILNAGFKRGGVIYRCERKGDGSFSSKPFPVYGPKGFAGLNALSQTLADRSFPIQMTQAKQRPPRLQHQWHTDVAARIRQDMGEWFKQHSDSVKQVYNGLSDGLAVLRGYDHRFQDISEPLIVLAAVADAENGGCQRHLSALLESLCLVGCQRLTDEGVNMAVMDTARQLLNGDNEAFVLSKDLLEKCRSNGLTKIESEKGLSELLSKFGLSSRSNGHARGYDITREWVEEWRKASVSPDSCSGSEVLTH